MNSCGAVSRHDAPEIEGHSAGEPLLRERRQTARMATSGQQNDRRFGLSKLIVVVLMMAGIATVCWAAFLAWAAAKALQALVG